MPLNPKDGAGAYIDDFKKSDAPQFKGKSPEKKRKMAVAAYLDAKRGPQEEVKTQQDTDIKDRAGTQPKNHYAGLKKKTKIARDKHFNKNSKKSDSDPSAYKSAPGDKTAKTKTSTYTKQYKKMYEDKVTKKQLNSLETILDRVFAKIGMDIEFTRHFLDRVNDARNKTQITPKELALLFKKEYIKWGKPIAKMGNDAEGVMKDLESDINIPFILKYNTDKKELEMVAKTVMRKKNFTTPDRKFPVESVSEGVNDPAIFHAVFLAGGPGSGKSFVVGQTALPALGYKVINSDNAFEMAMKKAAMETTPENIFSVKGQTLRKGASALTNKKMELALKGRLGLVIDGTGKDYNKIAKQTAKLRVLGYEVAMIFVNTDKETAIARDAKRKRTLGPDVVTKMWADVQKNIGKFQNLFRNKMFIVDNSDGSNWQGATMSAYKQIKKWSDKEPANKTAKNWIALERKPNPPTVRKEDVPGTSTTSVVGAGNNPTGTVVVDRRRRKDKHPKVLKRFRKYLDYDG